MATLHRYWVRFINPPKYASGHFGFGVTAWTVDDALALLAAQVFKDGPLPAIETLIEDVDISTLDAGHVRPNMEVPYWRGIWFPKGFAANSSSRT
jgi:hypothetical protein